MPGKVEKIFLPNTKTETAMDDIKILAIQLNGTSVGR